MAAYSHLFILPMLDAPRAAADQVVSTFNRLSPEHPGGRSLLALVEGEEGDPDPFGLRL